MSTTTTHFTPPIALPPDTIDDLIYCARAGDFAALKEDLTNLSKQHACPEATIVASAVDQEAETEGGTGSSVLHFPAANGNSGTSSSFTRFGGRRERGRADNVNRDTQFPPANTLPATRDSECDCQS